ncbi:MAG TPA: hypothetical protein VE027_02580 [Acidimicrobiia bacterium]|jgi:hypothetical protein|nr:hypothetical protein [Acidimicrobiia bacterium]
MSIQTRQTEQTDSCGKMRFTSQSTAQIAAKNKGKLHGVPFWVYRCPLCRHWHLTTKN